MSETTTVLRPRDWDSHPKLIDSGYKSTALRGPKQLLVPVKQNLANLRSPVYGHGLIGELDSDLTRNAVRNGEPLGERMIVTGRVLDEGGRPVPNTLVELWQANACGRYVHKVDQHDAPLDANFLGAGRALTDAQGRYKFLTIKPGAYPWKNHHNAWRPQHLHFSVFGQYFATRLVTQMYFPGDPLLAYDPIFQATPAHARDRLIARFSMDITEPEYALGYEFDIVLRGADQTPMES
ncbi:protocatechuate 3,4-dioxygenase subunit beta [Pandoraea bronchicola]|uniref:Protocatechuate 3,4-dioxygenase n=1 Tax=Pandoraea bronchicola TaxID=2508287 RepID=A0A5E5BR24_9BURK|nr:protocatechuate 3,4-dioxygenase subunit beta [Pandoraea bronchicola]VVE88309.1 protocatechuate 3,4-dioxygenase [Pandoraea bronchicola]